MTIIILGTHDILNATTTKTDDDAIVITTLYSEHSDARGGLFDFVFIDDNGDVDFTRSVLLALDRNASLHHTLPFNLYPGQYRVFVYDIESDGTLYNGVGYPAHADELYFIFEEDQSFTRPSMDDEGIIQSTIHTMVILIMTLYLYQLEYFDNCSITVFSGLILAVCSPINSTLVTGFQMIAQSRNSSQVHKLHINQNMTPVQVTVEVEESGVYQVTIIAMREGTGIVGSYVGYTGHVQVVVGEVTSYTTNSTTNTTGKLSM